jgi:hypothetical protein
MAVTVTPEQFTLVFFDAGRIAAVASEVLGLLGMDDDLAIEVDERTPVTRVMVTDGSPIVVRAESGAFEDLRQPRQMSDDSVRLALARVLVRVRDRRSGGFAEAPSDDQLTLAQVAAWDTYTLGRLTRMGLATHEQRWRYNFRNRHGFTDAADAAFDELWRADGLAWGGVSAVSERALAVASAPAQPKAG